MGHLNLVDMLARCYTMDEHVLGRRGCPHKPVTVQKLSRPHLRFKSRVSLFANSHHWTPPRDPGLAKEGIPDRIGFLRFRDPLSGLIQSNGSGMLVLYLHAANTRSSSMCIWCIAPSSWPQSPIWWLWFRIFYIVLCRVIKIKINNIYIYKYIYYQLCTILYYKDHTYMHMHMHMHICIRIFPSWYPAFCREIRLAWSQTHSWTSLCFLHTRIVCLCVPWT